MTPELSRGLIALAIFPSIVAPLCAREWEWDEAIGTDTEEVSGFTAMAVASGGPGGGVQAYLVGNFDTQFGFDSAYAGPGAATAGTGGGALVKRSELPDGGWQTDWMAVSSAPAQMFINDVAVETGGGMVFACGRFRDSLSFSDAGTNLQNVAVQLNAPGEWRGFIAWLDPATGAWLGSAETPDIVPEAMVVVPGGVLLTGPDFLAAKVLMDGTVEWATSSDPNTTKWKHIGIGSDPGDPFAYVLTEETDTGGHEDVVLHQVDRMTGAVHWTRRMGGPGEDRAGGLAVSHDGDVRVAFAIRGGSGTFDGLPLDVPVAAGSQQTFVARLRPFGELVWVTPVGSADENSDFYLTDMVVDPVGNTWATGVMDGGWSSFADEFDGDIDGRDDDTKLFSTDAVILAIDGPGKIFEFQRSGGSSSEKPVGIAAPTPDTVVLVGGYTGDDARFGGLPALPERVVSGAFLAVARSEAGQQLVRVRPNPAIPEPLSLRAIKSKIWALGVRAYVDLENGDDGTVASAWLSPAGIAALQGNPELIVEVEAELSVNGVTSDAGWGLARLNDGGTATPPAEVQPYVFPETDDTVVLYLIDTAVSNPNSWFDVNTKVTIEDSILIRGAGDPTESSEFEHGTRMLSMIAGPETGAALGTEIRVINYDIYPNGTTTTSALMAKAVIEAVQHHQADTSGDPGVVCIASSSDSGATSPTLKAAVDLAIAAGLVVVVSAGNDNDDVTNYIPASYGSDAGVVCVGGSDQNNARLSISNHGTAIDLFAPGEAVRNLRFSNPVSGFYDEMTGTSASAAFAAAAAAVEFSRDTQLTPSGVESALVTGLFADTVDVLQLGPETLLFSDWSLLHGIDPPNPSGDNDGDGVSELLEYFYGSDPTDPDGSMSSVSRDPVTGKLILSFPVSVQLFDPGDPYVLLDGTTWEVEVSCDMVNWSTASGSLSWGTAGAKTIPVSFETAGVNSCFLRIKVMP